MCTFSIFKEDDAGGRKEKDTLVGSIIGALAK